MNEIIIEQAGEIPFSSLDIRRKDIWLGMGYKGHIPEEDVLEYLASLEREAEAVTRARYCLRVYRNGGASDGTLRLGSVELHPGEVIFPIAAEAAYECIFTASAGMEFHRWLLEAGASGDIMRQFTADCIGSELAEAAARYAAGRLTEAVAEKGWAIGNSYSPGYCGWNVVEQRKMFSLLPSEPCGIILNDSCLMTPVKSVSGIIPVGPGIVKKRYSCAVCPRKDCFKKLRLKKR